ncbi:MAG TPA: methyltransferase dimerization domain-containing protein [Candidatus Tectomicrobia bacterium]|nr:methyltransferase dimerization domain-containing protein [Candidatus Tectomicrobia bacterium]
MGEGQQVPHGSPLAAPQTLLALINGHWTTQVLYVAAKLGLADLLAAGLQSADALAQATATHPEALRRLLWGLTSLGVCAEGEDGDFALTPLGAALRTGVPGSVRHWAIFRGEELYAIWGQLLHSVRTGEPAFPLVRGMPSYDYFQTHPEVAATFNRAMLELTQFVADAECRALMQTAEEASMKQGRPLLTLQGIGTNSAWVFVMACFGWRAFRNGQEVGALSGVPSTPDARGHTADARGIAQAGNDHIRAMAMEMAWGWRRLQPASALTPWYQQRLGPGGSRLRRRGMVARARKLLMALWRFVETGVLPDGAALTAARVYRLRDWAGVGRSRGDRVRDADRS